MPEDAANARKPDMLQVIRTTVVYYRWKRDHSDQKVGSRYRSVRHSVQCNPNAVHNKKSSEIGETTHLRRPWIEMMRFITFFDTN